MKDIEAKEARELLDQVKQICNSKGKTPLGAPRCYEDDVLSITQYSYEYEVVTNSDKERVLVGGTTSFAKIYEFVPGPWQNHIKVLWEELSQVSEPIEQAAVPYTDDFLGDYTPYKITLTFTGTNTTATKDKGTT